MSSVSLHPHVSVPVADQAISDGDSARRHHTLFLRMAIFAVVMACLLIVRADGRVAFFFAPGWAVPESCPSHFLLHVDCPGCGLTRSFVSLAHGQWRQSLAF